MENHKNPILVGVDYSKTSKMALREAVRIANAQGLAIKCIHVMDEEVVEVFKKNHEFDLAGVMDFANSRLEIFIADSVGVTKNITAEVLLGNPFREVIKTVEAIKPSLLVLGANGSSNRYSGRAGMLATRCVGKAPVDVMLVRRGQDRPFKSIIACVDFSENSIQAAFKAGELAELEGASLRLLHLYQPSLYCEPAYGFASSSISGGIEASVIEQLEEKLQKLSKEVQTKYASVEIDTAVKPHMRVSYGVAEQIEEVGADLVVLGTRGRTGLKIFLLGTTAGRIVHDSKSSVYTIKPEGFEYHIG